MGIGIPLCVVPCRIILLDLFIYFEHYVGSFL